MATPDQTLNQSSSTSPVFESELFWRRLYLLSFTGSLAFVYASAPILQGRGLGDPYLTWVDAFGYYSYLPAIFLRQTLDFDGLYTDFISGAGSIFRANASNFSEAETFRNVWTVGCAVLWAPFYLLSHALVLSLNLLGASLPADGLRWPHQTGVVTATVIYFFAGLALFHRVLSRLFCRSSADLTVALCFGATFLINYVLYRNLMSHALSFFASTLYLLSLIQIERTSARPGPYVAAALSLGLVVLIRPQNILIGIPLAWFLIRDLIALVQLRPVDFPRVTALLISPWFVIVVFSLQMILWKGMYGQWLLIPQNSFGPGQFMKWGRPMIFQVLFSKYHGLFYWHPVFLLAVGAVAHKSIRRGDSALNPGLYRAIFVSFLLMSYLNASVSDWWAGHSFGMRRFDAMVPFLLLALGDEINDFLKFPTPKRKRFLFGGAVVLICWNGAVWILFVFNLWPSAFPYFPPPAN